MRFGALDSLRDGERLVVEGRGRDEHDDVHVHVRLVLDEERTIVEISEPDAQGLVGASVRRGFRKSLAAALPTHVEARTLLHLLLDDLPGAVLVTGYGMMRAGVMPPASQRRGAEHLAMQRDLCAGWAADGIMMRTAESSGAVPMPDGQPAPPLEGYDLPPLPVEAMRRARRLEVDDDGRFDVHFRDSLMEPAGELVLHEYRVTGTVADGAVTSIRPEAVVLPWPECPGALASAQRLVGAPLRDIPTMVRADFHGTSTCTHLNDTLRSLTDLAALTNRV